MLEVIWAVSPAAFFVFIGSPFFSLLYSTDETVDPYTTFKVVGHEWYWSYEYSDYVSHGLEVTVYIKSVWRISDAVPTCFLGLQRLVTTNQPWGACLRRLLSSYLAACSIKPLAAICVSSKSWSVGPFPPHHLAFLSARHSGSWASRRDSSPNQKDITCEIRRRF